ncbi:hypothetical protein NM688_g1818 [Phlebia brevispora]|uniref:Uncharacterized protein n=1 Tax=Phlebia brevispora TaxID=194682 RepID=A0ACC1TB12_9APHY|nr:hypothetical protein NM688_g1818 [Phlebia brevispora]
MSRHSKEEEFTSAAPGVIPYDAFAADLSLSWGFLAKVLRDSDQSQVLGCKEDIDTLLVFAGLFSAVMTAFIIEVYKNLLPDPTTAVTSALATISSQMSSFIVTGRFANSTFTAISDTSTASNTRNPSPTMIRINSLWFASLICSLVAASLGMLVKQWLREYLDGQQISPQARARIRHFRYEGLTRWRVFEIAAILPLLLQIALGLFFLGLCFFTLSLNDTLAWTNIPLIIAWFTLFIFAVFAPITSAHCPYKIPLLEALLKSLRKAVRHYIIGARMTPGRPRDGSRGTRKHFLLEEEDVLTSESFDLKIILAVDSILSDDELLATVIRKALSYIHGAGADVLDFVASAAQRRSQATIWDIGSSRDDDIRYMSRLTARCRDALVEILADTLWPEMKKSEATAVATYLMYDAESFRKVVEAQDRALSAQEFTLLLSIAQEKLQGRGGEMMLHFTQYALRWLSKWPQAEDGSAQTVEGGALDSILKSSYAHPRAPRNTLPHLIGRALISALDPILKDTANTPDVTLDPTLVAKHWMKGILTYLIDTCDPTSDHHCIPALDDISDFIVRALMHAPWSTSMVLQTLIQRSHFDWHARYWMFGLLLKQKLFEKNGLSAALINIHKAIVQNELGLPPLGFCVIMCNMASYFFTSDDLQAYHTDWQAVFSALAEIVVPGSTVADKSSAAHCLQRIEIFDGTDKTAVRANTSESPSIVPDALVSTLAKMVTADSAKVEVLGRVRALPDYADVRRLPTSTSIAYSDEHSPIIYVSSATDDRDHVQQPSREEESFIPPRPASDDSDGVDLLAPTSPTFEDPPRASSSHVDMQVGPARPHSPEDTPSLPQKTTSPWSDVPPTPYLNVLPPLSASDNPSRASSPGPEPYPDLRTVSRSSSLLDGGTIRFNPLLDGESDSENPLVADLSKSTGVITFVATRGFGFVAQLTANVYLQLATLPPVKRMTITCDECPSWLMVLAPNKDISSRNSYDVPDGAEFLSVDGEVTVGDVLNVIRQTLQRQITQIEWERVPESRLLAVKQAFNDRCSRSGPLRGVEQSQGIKRVDLLERKYMFRGLVRTGGASGDFEHVKLRLEYPAFPAGATHEYYPTASRGGSSERPPSLIPAIPVIPPAVPPAIPFAISPATGGPPRPIVGNIPGFIPQKLNGHASYSVFMTPQIPAVPLSGVSGHRQRTRRSNGHAAGPPPPHHEIQSTRQTWTPYHNLPISVWLSSLDADPKRWQDMPYVRFARSLRRGGISDLGHLLDLDRDIAIAKLRALCWPNMSADVAEQLLHYAYTDGYGRRSSHAIGTRGVPIGHFQADAPALQRSGVAYSGLYADTSTVNNTRGSPPADATGETPAQTVRFPSSRQQPIVETPTSSSRSVGRDAYAELDVLMNSMQRSTNTLGILFPHRRARSA